MEITKDITVKVICGFLELRIGKEMTSFYYKDQEKFVFRTSEVNVLVEMIQKGREEYDKKT